VPDEHEYMKSCGFDVFLHEVDDQPILFFRYGHFFSAICLSSRHTDWREILIEWKTSHVGCPIDYAYLQGDY
jgi:hypothetical protein